jgi:hypothetical protein
VLIILLKGSENINLMKNNCQKKKYKHIDFNSLYIVVLYEPMKLSPCLLKCLLQSRKISWHIHVFGCYGFRTFLFLRFFYRQKSVSGLIAMIISLFIHCNISFVTVVPLIINHLRRCSLRLLHGIYLVGHFIQRLAEKMKYSTQFR